METKYSQSFKNDEAAEHYEQRIYQSDSYDTFIWNLQKKLLLSEIETAATHRRLKHLDFACGTGRIISLVEQFTDKSVGLDISPNMLKTASTKVQRAELREGNIIKQPDVVDFDYDVITAFRFFLNAEPDVRQAVMQSLSSRLRDSGSRFIFNIQGNSASLRHIILMLKKTQGERHSEMSYSDVRTLADDAGLKIVSWYGFGVCPAFLHRSRLGPIARFIDKLASRLPLMKRVSIDLLFICKPK